MSILATGLNGSAAESCFQDLTEEALKGEKGFKLGDVDIGELRFTPPNVDEAKAWQIVVPVEITSGAAKGFSPDVYLDFVVLREGDSVATVTTEDVFSEFDEELRNQLVQRSPTACPSRPNDTGARAWEGGVPPTHARPSSI